MNIKLVNPLHWNRKFFLLAMLLSFALWIGFIDTYSISTRMGLRSDILELEEQIESLNTQSEELEQKIQHFKDNPDLLEKIAREEYFMRKPGEQVYRIHNK